MAGDTQDKPISSEDVESAVKTLMDDDPFGQGDVPAARYLNREPGTMTVSELLARVCFISWLKTIIFSLPGRWPGAVVAILTLLVRRLRAFLDQLLARLDTRDNDNDHLPHDQDLCGGEYLLQIPTSPSQTESSSPSSPPSPSSCPTPAGIVPALAYVVLHRVHNHLHCTLLQHHVGHGQ